MHGGGTTIPCVPPKHPLRLVRHQRLHPLPPHRRRWLVRRAIHRMLGQLAHRSRYSLLELRIVTIRDFLRPVLDVDVRRDPLVLHRPFFPSRSKKPPRGAIMIPPSTNGGVSQCPPVRPTCACRRACRSCACLNMYGIRSPPDPAISLMIITFGPQIPAAGLVNGYLVPTGLLK